MDERQLSVLRELAERGSLVAAARALHVTPSAVSQQLAALQRSCPAPLTEPVRLVGETLAADEDAITARVQLLFDGKVRAEGEALWKRWRPRP